MTRVGSVVAAALLAVAATVLPGVSVAPAAAAACTDAGGITVVVDPGSLPGSLSQTCVASGGDDAAALFAAAGHSLERVQRFPGAICKVDAPARERGLRQHASDQRLLGPVLVQRHVGVVGVRQRGRRLPVRPGGRVGRVRVAGQQLPAQPGRRSARPRRVRAGRRRVRRVPEARAARPAAPVARRAEVAASRRTARRRHRRPARRRGRVGVAPRAGPRPGSRSRSRGVRPAARRGVRRGHADRRRHRAAGPDGPGVAAPPSDAAADGGLPLWLVGLAALGLLGVGTAGAVVRRRAASAGGA